MMEDIEMVEVPKEEIPKEKPVQPCSCIKFTPDELQVMLYAITNQKITIADRAFPYFLSSMGKIKQILKI